MIGVTHWKVSLESQFALDSGISTPANTAGGARLGL
jgi:hypothetical protein